MFKLMAAAVLAAAWISGVALAAPAVGGAAPEMAQGLELRARHGIATAANPYTIHVRSRGTQPVSREVSTLATRDAVGHWSVSQVSEDRPGRITVNRLYVRKRTLSPDEAAGLDRLLAARRLYAAKTPADMTQPNVGTYVHTMEIVTPKGRAVVRWSGEPRGRAGKVAELVMGWDAPATSWEVQVAGRELKPAAPEGG